MPRPDLNIIVCVDRRKCLNAKAGGLNGPVLLEELRASVEDSGLQDQVQVTPCRCILGCTYGPRIDVAQRWSGEKVLYGTTEGRVTISIRGRVTFSRIPEDLASLITDNLPGE
jgi:hypothetical protein